MQIHPNGTSEEHIPMEVFCKDKMVSKWTAEVSSYHELLLEKIYLMHKPLLQE